MTAGGYDENSAATSPKGPTALKKRRRRRRRKKSKQYRLDYTTCNALCKRGSQIDIPFWLFFFFLSFSLNAFDLRLL
jgi:hypothetical protein